MAAENLTPQGMSTSEIIALIGIVLAIIKVWIQSQMDVAKIKVQIAEVNKRQDQTDEALKEHKQEDAKKLEIVRAENREDHQLLFKKIDDLVKAIPHTCRIGNQKKDHDE